MTVKHSPLTGQRFLTISSSGRTYAVSPLLLVPNLGSSGSGTSLLKIPEARSVEDGVNSGVMQQLCQIIRCYWLLKAVGQHRDPRELGLLRQRSQSTNGSKTLLSNQIFAYLIVIDFESTCWKEKTNYGQEIIEFPAVLLNTSTGEIESEFHTYVQPQERPLLSEFCTELTGIKQVSVYSHKCKAENSPAHFYGSVFFTACNMQVEAGIPLQICLSRFNRWLQKMQVEKGLVFPNGPQKSSAPSPSHRVLSSRDWDLGVCLQYECKRKQLHKPDMFYDKKPKGLNGALQDLGIQFAGREHSGLDDSRNTACLAVRMMRDGCVMKITRSLEKAPSMVKPMFGNTTADSKKEKSKTDEEKNTSNTEKPSSSKIPPKLRQIKSCSEDITKYLDTKENSVQSLISPKTLMNGTNTPLMGCSRMSVSAGANTSSLVRINCPSPHNNTTSLVLCSTTLGCLSNFQTSPLKQEEKKDMGKHFVWNRRTGVVHMMMWCWRKKVSVLVKLRENLIMIMCQILSTDVMCGESLTLHIYQVLMSH
ncbi:hypothetical protein F7725_005948 [Dissostichus mawsoni]|uniref:Exonuclease domain-containing protein n=1 Tax=Dissostichus mawsoni TaxID=36200 RepID=A0A7J5YTV6_DISMA|nr:hypothetical protein F7725_005948 [Dissostichus mawsoni]